MRNSGCLTSDQLNSRVHGFKGSDSQSLPNRKLSGIEIALLHTTG